MIKDEDVIIGKKNLVQNKSYVWFDELPRFKQGDKIAFKWHGSNMLYIGRIEKRDKSSRIPYFVNEHCYKDDKITEINEGMRFYNSLSSFSRFTAFYLLD